MYDDVKFYDEPLLRDTKTNHIFFYVQKKYTLKIFTNTSQLISIFLFFFLHKTYMLRILNRQNAEDYCKIKLLQAFVFKYV